MQIDMNHRPYLKSKLFMMNMTNRSGAANILLQFPLAIIQRTDITRLEPSRDTMEMEGMLTVVIS